MSFLPELSTISHIVRLNENSAQSQEQQLLRTMGRVYSVREHARVLFFDLVHEGVTLQVGVEAPNHLIGEISTGVWVEVVGRCGMSRLGSVTFWAEHVDITQTPSYPIHTQRLHGRDLPEQSLLLHPQRMRLLQGRARIQQAIRRWFEQREFMEIETPLLHRHATGALARAFETHSRARDLDMFLRIALEPYHIRLLVAGANRLFEMGRCFRNEGVSMRHQPEFTLLEAYEAGANMEQSMQDVLDVVRSCLAVNNVNSSSMPFGQHTLCWDHPRVVSMRQIVFEHTSCQSFSDCRQWLLERGISFDENDEAWALQYVFEQAVEPFLFQPTFVTEHPVCTSSLALSVDGVWTRRFELFVGGMELANGYEQNRDRQEQARRWQNGSQADEEYLFAMGWGLPPLSGFGIGVDRLCMLGLDCLDIRDVCVFAH